ncbi:hypothetical protein M0534_04920 [Methylonatrum kenyense]|uniref:NfeD family protein n=1 Tax=Methylonatrum kenyense TaxID=455253 RepID=UPI0020BFF155|nr:NfeD family protein [Methylonatrum kenyense]MCK8515668.1 hypothetical protein [Methylonatrum kenyense]
MALLTMSPGIRYTLLQVPGLVFLGTLLWIAWDRGWLGSETAGLLLLIWVVKDVLLYPLYRPALRGPAPSGGSALVGMQARVRRRLAPVGQVTLFGEVWRARSSDDAPIESGERVTVVAAKGLTLMVVPVRKH